MQGIQETQVKSGAENIRSANPVNTAAADPESAPLYASPWLAFFYLIRQGWNGPDSDS